MNEFEKWYKIDGHLLAGMHEDVIRNAFKAGMLAAAKIADSVWADGSGRGYAYEASEDIREAAEEL